MDWDLAIERNRAALKRVLAMLIVMAGLERPPLACRDLPFRHLRFPPQGGRSFTLPRLLHRAILRLLRPAESAARRLVIVFARNVVVTLQPRRPRKPQPAPTILRDGVGTGIVLPGGFNPARAALRSFCLSLTDPLRRRGRRRRSAVDCTPRICFPGFAAPAPVPARPLPGDRIDATRLAQRLAALASALDDLPSHARRFARWRARRDAGRIRRTWPLRAGKPPGQRGARSLQPVHEVHDILDNLHGLAFTVQEPADTS